MSVQFGLLVPQGWKMDLVGIGDPTEQYEAMTHVAREADRGGWDSIWVFDHFHTVPEPTLETTFECWTISATLARDTNNVKIGQMVGCNGYRNPALYAKIASTVDVASHGRLYAGIGAGRHYAIDGPINEPKGAVPGRKIPLWIGGGGEKVTLKLVAQYGDACNIGRDPEVCRHKLEVLKGHCEDVGRDYDEIIRSAEADVFLLREGEDPEEATAHVRGDTSFEQFARGTVVGTPEQVRNHVQALVGAGIDYVIVYMRGLAHDREPIERFAEEVIPAFS